MRAIFTRLAMAGTSLVLAACNGIGDGNTLRTLEIVPASTLTQVSKFETGGTYRLHQCLRDELILQGTFDSGAVASFNSRATWTSSDPDKVQVSNRDIPLAIVSNGAFSTVDTQPYISGTVVPVGNLGDTATITATFAGLSASINVVIGKPSLRLVPVPHPNNVDPRTFSGPAYLGVDTNQRLALVGDFDGRFVSGIGAGALNTLLNPVLWKFPGGEYRVIDEDPATTFDNRWVIPGATPETPLMSLTTSGTVRGLIADPTEYEVEASLSLCPDEMDPDLRPVTTVRVLPFDSATPISIDRQAGLHEEAGFMPAPGFNPEQMVAGTSQQLTAIGRLDLDGASIVDQDLSEQLRFNVEPRDAGCDSKGVNCADNSLFTIVGVSLSAVSGNGRLNDGFDFVCLTTPDDPECDKETDPDADPVNIEACFPLCMPRLASLEITSTVPLVDPEVTLMAKHHNLDGTPTYIFDCGEGFDPQSSASETVVCDYGTATGTFTPTVRVLDDSRAVSVNAGAVQVSFDAAPGDNTPPTVTLVASPTTATVPAVVFLSAAASDANTGDAVTYYQFQPDDGVVIRQSSSVLSWVYLIPPAAGFPKVNAYDKFNAESTSATVALTLTSRATPAAAPVRSAPLVVESVQATPCELRILPTAEDAVSEQVFTFPGVAFRAIASFIADPGDDTEDCAVDPVIGTQDVTRFMFWAAHPDAESTEFSEFVTIRNNASDFQQIGQAFYQASPTANTTVTVKATPGTVGFLKDVPAPDPSTLTVECLPPVCAP